MKKAREFDSIYVNFEIVQPHDISIKFSFRRIESEYLSIDVFLNM
jgi:hypothetical protein